MQVPFSKKHKPLPLPTIGYAVPVAGYQGPRITKAPVTVANHIQAYYRFCALLLALTMMSVLGIIAVVISANKTIQCPASVQLNVWLIIFGILDLCFFTIILIIVIVRGLCCPDRSGVLGGIAMLMFTIFCVTLFLYAIFALVKLSMKIYFYGDLNPLPLPLPTATKKCCRKKDAKVAVAP